MPVAVRLIEVLAIVTLVATMAAGAAIVIFMEKCLWFLLMITEPLGAVINLCLAALQYIFLVRSNKFYSKAWCPIKEINYFFFVIFPDNSYKANDFNEPFNGVALGSNHSQVSRNYLLSCL